MNAKVECQKSRPDFNLDWETFEERLEESKMKRELKCSKKAQIINVVNGNYERKRCNGDFTGGACEARTGAFGEGY